MLAYKENVKLDSNKLIIDLPDDFVGSFVEVIVLGQNTYHINSEDKAKFLVNEPYKFDLDPNSTFSREELYD